MTVYPRRPPDVGDVARRLLRSRRPLTPTGNAPNWASEGPLGIGRGANPTPPSGNTPGGGGGYGGDIMNGGGMAAGAPDGLDPSSIQGQVQAQLDPILQYITQKYNAQAQGVSSAFGQLTDQYAGAMGRYAGQVPGMFGPSEKIVGGAAKGLRNELSDLGATLNKTQSEATQFAGLPKSAGAEDIKLNKIGRGSGGAAYAIGGAMLDALRAEQASAQKYASQLPGFAKLEGAQNTRDVLSQLAVEMADQLAQTTAQAPQLYYQIYNDLQDRMRSDRTFAEQVREFDLGRQDTLAANQAATAQRRAGIAGPTAPTLGGRKAYWDSVAADRTKTTGYQWVGTTTGIRPLDADPRTPGIQPSLTLQGSAAQQAGIKTQAQITAERRRVQIAQQNANTSSRNADTSARRAAIAARQAGIAQQRENNRHAEAERRLGIAGRNATTSAQRAAVARRAAAETARHNRETEAIARKKKAAGGTSFNPAAGDYGP